jgi:hyperosmotically inducible protein
MGRACSGRRPRRFRLPATVLLLAALLIAGCGAATSATKDDASIETRVKIALLNDPHVGPLRLDARAAQGVVTLSGTVKSPSEAATAIAVARKVPGARDVKSDLKIVP